MNIKQLDAAQTMIKRWRSLNEDIPRLHDILGKLADGETVCSFEFTIKEPVDNSREVQKHALDQLDNDSGGLTATAMPSGMVMINTGPAPKPDDVKMIEYYFKGNVRDTLMLQMATCLLADKMRQKENIENNLESLGIKIEG